MADLQDTFSDKGLNEPVTQSKVVETGEPSVFNADPTADNMFNPAHAESLQADQSLPGQILAPNSPPPKNQLQSNNQNTTSI